MIICLVKFLAGKIKTNTFKKKMYAVDVPKYMKYHKLVKYLHTLVHSSRCDNKIKHTPHIRLIFNILTNTTFLFGALLYN